MPTQNKQQNAETPRKLNLANARVVLSPDPLLPQDHYQRKILNPQIFRFGRAKKLEKGMFGLAGYGNRDNHQCRDSMNNNIDCRVRQSTIYVWALTIS